VLEPGDTSPFYIPMMFGVLFSLGGLLMGFQTGRYVYYRGAIPPMDLPTRARFTAILSSTLLYVTLVVVFFDSGVQEVQALAAPSGVHPTLFFVGLQTLLYLPIPWAFWHLVTLTTTEYGIIATGPIAVMRLALRERRREGPRARSANVVLFTFAYVMAVFGAWIAYAAVQGF
jgi:hypothetical protein